MNEVRYRDDTNTRRRVRDRGRGKIYQRGNTTVINLGALVFGRRPEVDIQSDYRADVDISNRACVYPKVRY